MKDYPKAARVYMKSIYAITLILLFLFYRWGYIKLDITSIAALIFFSLLIALTESFTVLHKKVSYSTTFAVELAVYLVFGFFFTMLAVILGYSMRIIKLPGENKYKHFFNTPFYGTVFNYCVLILPLLIAHYAYVKTGGQFVFNSLGSNLYQNTIFSLNCFLINTFLLSMLLTTITKKNIISTFIGNLRLILINFIIMVPFGIMLAMMYNVFGYLGVLFLFFPIVLVRFTFSLYIDSKTQFIQTVDSLMRAVEARDQYTEGHSQRVAKIVELIAKELKYSDMRIEQLNIASVLHDVGKIGVDDYILNKPGKLTDEEFNTIKKHPEIGYNILKDVKNLENVIDLVRHHHERYDGKGYPDGKDKDTLSFDVFIIQLADAIDAMATDRPYRKGLTEDEMDAEVHRNNGTQFHPKVVEAYFKAKEKIKH